VSFAFLYARGSSSLFASTKATPTVGSFYPHQLSLSHSSSVLLYILDYFLEDYTPIDLRRRCSRLRLSRADFDARGCAVRLKLQRCRCHQDAVSGEVRMDEGPHVVIILFFFLSVGLG
jgi:hypothetical protein